MKFYETWYTCSSSGIDVPFRYSCWSDNSGATLWQIFLHYFFPWVFSKICRKLKKLGILVVEAKLFRFLWIDNSGATWWQIYFCTKSVFNLQITGIWSNDPSQLKSIGHFSDLMGHEIALLQNECAKLPARQDVSAVFSAPFEISMARSKNEPCQIISYSRLSEMFSWSFGPKDVIMGGLGSSPVNFEILMLLDIISSFYTPNLWKIIHSATTLLLVVVISVVILLSL